MKKLFIIPVLLITLGTELSAAEDYNTLYSKALILVGEKQYSEALPILQKLKADFPADARILYRIAECYIAQQNADAALEHCALAIAADASYTEPYILQFNIYNQQKKFQEASDTLLDMLRNTQNNIEYWYTLGIINLSALQNIPVAEFAFNRLVEISKTVPLNNQFRERIHLILSEINFKNQNYIESIEQMHQAVKLNPDNNINFYKMSSVFINRQMIQETILALDYFTRYLTPDQEKNPVAPKIRAYLGQIYYVSGNPEATYFISAGKQAEGIEGEISNALFRELSGERGEELLSTMQALSNRAPKYVAPHYGLYKLYLADKNHKAALNELLAAASLLVETNLDETSIRVLRQALALAPDMPELHQQLGALYERNDRFSNAAYHFAKALELGGDKNLQLHLGYIYSRAGRIDASNRAFAAALRLDPESPRYYLVHGATALQQESYKAAVPLLEKALTYDEKNAVIHFYLAVACEENKDHAAAIDAAIKAVELDKENPDYSNFLSYLYADSGEQLDRAFDLIQTALKKDPYNGAYLDTLGWIYFRQGKYSESLTKLLQAERNLYIRDEVDAVVLEHIGDAYSKLGDISRAILWWKKALGNGAEKKLLDKINNSEK